MPSEGSAVRKQESVIGGQNQANISDECYIITYPVVHELFFLTFYSPITFVFERTQGFEIFELL